MFYALLDYTKDTLIIHNKPTFLNQNVITNKHTSH